MDDSGVARVGVAVGVEGGNGHIESTAGGGAADRGTEGVVSGGGMVDRDSTRCVVDGTSHRVRAGDSLAGGGLQSVAVRQRLRATLFPYTTLFRSQDGLTV